MVRLMGKGLAKVEKHGIMKSGVQGAGKLVPGHTGGSLPKAGKSDTATSKVKQPKAFTNPTSQSGYTRFVS